MFILEPLPVMKLSLNIVKNDNSFQWIYKAHGLFYLLKKMVININQHVYSGISASENSVCHLISKVQNYNINII